MIPGTRPTRRSARAAPLPARERDAALITLTVAMIVSSSLKPSGPGPKAWACCSGLIAAAASRGAKGAHSPQWRAYSGAKSKKQGNGFRRNSRQGGLRAAGAGWCRGRARTAGRGCRTAKPRLQGSNPGPERFIFLAGEPRHTLNGLEFLSMDARELAENPLRLGAEQCLGLAPHALRYPRRIVHQSRNFVEEPVRGLDHVRLRKEFASAASERFRLSLAIPLHNGNGGAPSQGVRRRIRLRGPGRDPLTRLELL